MFALPGTLTLVAFVYLRPHEIFPFLRGVPCIPILFAVALLGLLLDLRLRLSRPWLAPHTFLAIALVLWAVVATALGASASISRTAASLSVPLAIFLLVSHAAQGFRALEAVSLVLVGIALSLSLMGVVQAQAPQQCIRVEPGATTGEMNGVPEDRLCNGPNQCDQGGEPGYAYICEKPGPAGTTSIGDGRVRYRGILQDPNELAMAIGLTFPLGLTLWTRRRSILSSLLLAALLTLGGTCIILTASRTGQMVVIAVAAAYFAVRFKWKGLALGGVLAMPALILGGRSSGEASASSQERLEAWSAGLRFLRSSPVWGIGQDQFPEHHYITAHNSFVLAAAELGFVGLVVFIGLYYLSFKIVLSGMRHTRDIPEAKIAYLWGRGLLAALCGLVAGSFFLSLTYHPVVWVFFALTAAYALALRHHDEIWKISLGWRDVRTVLLLAGGFLVSLQIYTKLKGL
jgi:hypothetical protein